MDARMNERMHEGNYELTPAAASCSALAATVAIMAATTDRRRTVMATWKATCSLGSSTDSGVASTANTCENISEHACQRTQPTHSFIHSFIPFVRIDRLID